MNHLHLALALAAVLVANGALAEVVVNSTDSDVNQEAPQEVWGIYPSLSADIPKQFVLTNETAASIAGRVSKRVGGKRVVIFNTLRFGDAADVEALGMASNFAFHLNNQNLLQHTVLITTDEATWKSLRSRGLPAYLDRAFPRRSAYVNQVKAEGTENREFDIEKHWWGWKFTSLGFRVVYMDSDAVVLGDLMKPFSHPFGYDVQGLTDWEDLDHPEMDRAYTLNRPCGLYLLREDDRYPWGSKWVERWNYPNENLRLTPNPCQSTGLWYLEPTEAAIDFMRAQMERTIFQHVDVWEQTSWNEILLHFLWGAGDHEPVKYRSLPLADFANLDSARSRMEKGMPSKFIIMHMGGVHGERKRTEIQALGLWNGEYVWDKGLLNKKGQLVGGGSGRAIFSHFSGRLSPDADMYVLLDWGWLIAIPLVIGVAVWRSRRIKRRAVHGPAAAHDV